MIKITSVGCITIIEVNDIEVGVRIGAIYDGLDATYCSPCEIGGFKSLECNVKFNGE